MSVKEVRTCLHVYVSYTFTIPGVPLESSLVKKLQNYEVS